MLLLTQKKATMLRRVFLFSSEENCLPSTHESLVWLLSLYGIAISDDKLYGDSSELKISSTRMSWKVHEKIINIAYLVWKFNSLDRNLAHDKMVICRELDFERVLLVRVAVRASRLNGAIEDAHGKVAVRPRALLSQFWSHGLQHGVEPEAGRGREYVTKRDPVFQNRSDKLRVAELLVVDELLDRGARALVILLDLGGRFAAADDVAGDEREELEVAGVDGLGLVWLSELKWGVLAAFGERESGRVEDPALPEEDGGKTGLDCHGDGEEGVRGGELAGVDAMLEERLEAEARGGAGGVSGEERALEVGDLELDELAEGEACADGGRLGVEGVLEPRAADEEIFLGPGEVGVEAAGERPHAPGDVDEVPALGPGGRARPALVLELLDALARVPEPEEGAGDRQVLVDAEVLGLGLEHLVVLPALAGPLCVLERFIKSLVELLLVPAPLALVVQLRRLLQPREHLRQPLERRVLLLHLLAQALLRLVPHHQIVQIARLLRHLEWKQLFPILTHFFQRATSTHSSTT